MTKVNSITIDSGCFSNNTTINSVDLGNAKWTNNSLSSAFKNCTALTSISQINSSITNLDNAFEGCSLLSGNINLDSSDISSASDCFKSTSLKKNVFIPYESTTYNTLTALGYDEEGSLNGVYLKDKDGEYDKWYNWKSGSSELGEWVESSLPSYQYWFSVTYGNGKFVAIASNSDVFEYSNDGINWTEGTMTSKKSWDSVTYGNDKFVAVVYNSNVFAYSDDGISWTEGTLPNSLNWSSVTYGNGKFVTIASNSDVFAYSTDGINWTEGTLPNSLDWSSVTYGNGMFVAVDSSSNVCAYLPYSSLQCFTDTSTPTTASKVYSAPSVESTLTITATGEGTITLSDEKTYIRNPQGDDYTKHSSFDPSTLKYGDRIGDGEGVATVVGDFTDNNGQKYKFAVLDAKYMGYIAWASSLYETDTGLPNYYPEPTSQNKESATYNTDYILNNYSGSLESFTHCDNAISIEFGGTTYKAKLPNAYELQQIFINRSDLYSKDPTASSYTAYNLASWSFNGDSYVWSSNECDSDCTWILDSDGYWDGSSRDSCKNSTCGIIPILEIPYE